MTVYIEYVIIDNLVIDYIILKATCDILGTKKDFARLLICCLLGTAVALIIPLIYQNLIFSIIVRAITGFIISLIATKHTSFRAYLIFTLVFFAFTFLLGGALIGIFNLFNIDYSSEVSISLIVLPVYILYKCLSGVIKYLYRQKDIVAFTFDLEITIGQKVKVAKGFLDTGNAVYDGESPVIFCEKSFFNNFIDGNFYKLKLKKILINTISGQTENYAIKIDQLKIYINGQENIIKMITLCIANSPIGDGYDIILHPAIFKESNYEEVDRENKKVS